MIAVDTNVLVYARRAEMSRHEEALEALRTLAEGTTPWGLPVTCIVEFVRVVTHPRLFDPPTEPDAAVAFLRALLESPSVRLLLPDARFVDVFEEMLEAGAVRGNLVFDAAIAALCLGSGARDLLTEDRDFTRFPGLRVVPLSDL